MEQNKKILNNSYNNIEFAKERTLKSASISVNLDACGLYEEATTEDISDLITKRKLNETMLELFEKSKWKDKYGGDKKVEKSDYSDLFYYFNDILTEQYNYDDVDVFCVIMEFFGLNYSVMYNDILTMANKIKILKVLKERYGLKSELGTRACRLY